MPESGDEPFPNGYICRSILSDVDANARVTEQRFQKEAIYRQMQEYKREKNTLESQLELLQKESAYHDDHLRLIDAWFTQVGSIPISKWIINQTNITTIALR